jgi:glyoxylase-like metal-dependent hydrolase (beta-lactamase superfamily II)
MRTPDTTTEASAETRPKRAEDLPDYAPIPRPAFGPALNEQGYYVGRVKRNLYWVTDGNYQSAFLTTSGGVVLLDAPPTIGHNIQRAVDEIAAANGVSNTVTHLIYSHHHADHAGASSLFDGNVARIGHERRATSCCVTTSRRDPRPRRPSRIAARSRSAVSGSSWPGMAPITRPTTSSSTCPTTTR